MAPAGIAVWGLPVRIAHWGLAVLVVIDLLNEAGANPWHRYIGYAAAAIVVARIAHGLARSGPQSLAAMLGAARLAHAYAREPWTRERRPFVGHNPLGALMAFVLWLHVLALGVTGWMTQLDAFWGEDWLQDVHAVAAYSLAACAVVHVGGVLVSSYVFRVNLPRSMVTGRKVFPRGHREDGS